MATQQAKPIGKPDYAPPPIDGDFYKIASVLNDKERALLSHVREFTEGVIAPVIEDYWGRDAGDRVPGLWLSGRQLAGERLRCDGAGSGRCIGRDVLGRAHRPVGRLGLFLR